MTEGRAKGFVKWFNRKKRYGLIRHSNGLDVVVQEASIQADRRVLEAGANVEFEIEIGPKGPQAAKVRRVDRSNMEGA